MAILLISGISKAQVSANNNKSTINTEFKMSSIQRIKRLYETDRRVLNKRNMGLLQDLVSGDYVGAQGEKGPADLKKHLLNLLKLFLTSNGRLRTLSAKR